MVSPLEDSVRKLTRRKMKEFEKIMQQVKNHPKVNAVYLFGSYAKNEAKPISDIDIAVILKDPNKNDETDIGSLYSEKIGLILFHRLPVHIQYEVLKYGKELFNKDEEYLLELKLKVLREYLEYSRSYNFIKRSVLK